MGWAEELLTMVADDGRVLSCVGHGTETSELGVKESVSDWRVRKGGVEVPLFRC